MRYCGSVSFLCLGETIVKYLPQISYTHTFTTIQLTLLYCTNFYVVTTCCFQRFACFECLVLSCDLQWEFAHLRSLIYGNNMSCCIAMCLRNARISCKHPLNINIQTHEFLPGKRTQIDKTTDTGNNKHTCQILNTNNKKYNTKG